MKKEKSLLLLMAAASVGVAHAAPLASVSGSAFIPCIIEKSCSNTLLFCCYSLFPAIRKYFPVFF